jgi:tetratricopeptide (TPR) repeat protein
MKSRYMLLVFLVSVYGCGSGPLSSAQAARIESEKAISADRLFTRGTALAEQGQLVRAEQYLSLAASRGYPETRTVPILLKVCLAASRLRSALNYAEPFLARHPNDWKLRYLVASLYLGLDQPERAKLELERVLSEAPSHAPAHYLLAVLMRDSLADIGAAAEHFQEYLTLDANGDHAAEVSLWLREYRPSAGQRPGAPSVSRPSSEGERL